jgi:hypothetical protein
LDDDGYVVLEGIMQTKHVQVMRDRLEQFANPSAKKLARVNAGVQALLKG